MKLYKSIFVLLSLLLASCNQSLPSPQLPDLVVSFINVSMVDMNGRCLNGYQIQATISNQGTAIANNVTAVETSTGQTFTIDKLEAGQKFTVTLPANSPTGIYVFIVDPQNTTPEINETNNNLSFLSPTPTPPVECIQAMPGVTPVGTLDLSTDPSLSMTLTAAPTFPNVPPLSREVLLNSNYRSQDWGEFQLTDGVFERTSTLSVGSSDAFTTRFQEPIIFGDLNSDGSEDALVVLNTQNGGTGHFIELAAVLNQNGLPLNVSTLYLGDRVIVDSGYIQAGLIMLNMVVHAPNDGLCCPSQSVTWSFRLQDNQLIQLP
ncbi:MAG: hypothetical protein H7Y59_16870 [Anaerolineales bacterium]|nr:hypothetical protein [Anaerolineales bacterium]